MLWCITFSGMGDVQHDIAQYVQAPDIRAALDVFDAHFPRGMRGDALVKSCALVTTGRVIGGDAAQVIGPDDAHFVPTFEPPPFQRVMRETTGRGK